MLPLGAERCVRRPERRATALQMLPPSSGSAQGHARDTDTEIAMAMKRTAPISFHAKLAHPQMAETESERTTQEACAERVLQTLRKSHPRLATIDYIKGTDEAGDWLWGHVEDEDAVFTKTELTRIANAVRSVNPEICVWLWIQDDEEHEHGFVVLLDQIEPDEYRRD
jgi:hypothetical protein